MDDVTRHPLLVFIISLAILWFFAWLGASLIRRRGALAETAREDFGVILAATLTLLGLIIGFTFSMAISRYDLRKTYEEAEANAIGTEYVRADTWKAWRNRLDDQSLQDSCDRRVDQSIPLDTQLYRARYVPDRYGICDRRIEKELDCK